MERVEDVLKAGGIVPLRGRIALYSCYFGKHEPFYPHALGPEGDWDRIIFTDSAALNAPGHRIVVFPDGFDGLTAKQMSRLPKLWPERFLSQYDWVLYVDNRAQLLLSPLEVIGRLEAAHGGTAPAGRYLAPHRQRACSWRETMLCRSQGKKGKTPPRLDEAEADRLYAWFKATGLPRNAGLYVNTALVQRMGSEATARLNEAWFSAFCTIAGRDQVLLPNVIRITGADQNDLGFPLSDLVRWPVFGFRVRRRFQLGKPLPDGWDAPAAPVVPLEAEAPFMTEEAQAPSGIARPDVSADSQGEMPVQDFRKERKLNRRLAADQAQRLLAGSVLRGEDDMKLYRFGEDGKFDLDLYRQVQIEANKLKINNQWVPEEHIAILSQHILDSGAKPERGICHGTRRGNEQMWFRQYLGPQADVFGTEISDTATDFPHTIQWDFHEVDPAWVGAMDLVYSNSWDHAHDPERAFMGWISCLKPGGFLMLDHGWNYLPDRVSPMDPFGISEAGLVKMLDRLGASTGAVSQVLDGGKHKRHPIRTVVFRARA